MDVDVVGRLNIGVAIDVRLTVYWIVDWVITSRN